MKDINEVEEFAVGTIPGNTQLLSNLSEESDLLSQEISYLMGGVESYRDINRRSNVEIAISKEDYSFNLRALIDRILRYLTNLAQDIFDGSAAGALAIEATISRAERMLTNSRTQRRNHQKTTFLIGTRIANLSVRYKPIEDPQFLLSQLKILGTTLRSVLTYLTQSVFNGFQDLIGFDPLTGDIDQLARKLQSSAPSVLGGDNRFVNKGYAIYSPQLLGCQQVVIANARPDGAALEQILGCQMTIENAAKDPLTLPQAIAYSKFGITLEQSLIREVVEVANILSSTNTLSRRSLRRSRLKLINDRLATLGKQLNDTEIDEGTQVQIRNYIRILEVYSGWMSSPFVGIIALTHRNLSAILNVCEANAS